jgi:hypothetical protein
MAEEAAEARIDEALRFVNVVCMVLVVSVAGLAAVAWFVANGPGESGIVGPPIPAAAAYVLFAIGVALLVVAPLVHRRMLERSGRGQRADERLDGTLENYRLATLLAFILREGAAIVGLMITVLTNEPGWCYVLAALALVAMIAGWPRRDQLSLALSTT